MSKASVVLRGAYVKITARCKGCWIRHVKYNHAPVSHGTWRADISCSSDLLCLTQFGLLTRMISVFQCWPPGAAEGHFEVKDKYSTWGMAEKFFFFIFPPRVSLLVREVFQPQRHLGQEKMSFYRKTTVTSFMNSFPCSTSWIPIKCLSTYAQALNVLG